MAGIKVKRPQERDLEEMGVRSWGTWGCEASTFDWEYDQTEACYLLEGDVTVEHEGGSTRLQAGDLAIFPKGLKCRWNVKKPVKKHFRFEEE